MSDKFNDKQIEHIIDIIKKYFHVEYVGNGYPKMVLTTDALQYIKEDLEDDSNRSIK